MLIAWTVWETNVVPTMRQKKRARKSGIRSAVGGVQEREGRRERELELTARKKIPHFSVQFCIPLQETSTEYFIL